MSVKGKTNNPNGRPKGSPNKVTSTIRGWLVELINNNKERIERDFAELDPKDRLAMLEKFLPYLLPKVENAKEVEGACYTREDVKKTSVFEMQTEKTELKAWYD